MNYKAEIQDMDSCRIYRVRGGRWYQSGSVEDGPTENVHLDDQKRDGFVAARTIAGYLKQICVESFDVHPHKVEEFLISKGFKRDDKNPRNFLRTI